jgi:NAD(P)-dependent dehydrogenase (short-subunit alcohol dehydrogenase family)
MPDIEIAGATALVTGASRGFGRGIATALAKAGAQLTGYAAEESRREGLGIRFVSVLPQLTPATAPGAVYVAAYAARGGAAAPPGPPLTLEQAGQAVIDLVAGDAYDQSAYLLTAAGLRPLP